MITPAARKKILRRFVKRSIAGERLGFEAYVWAAQRVSGFVLFIFLFMHLYTLSAAFGGAQTYDEALRSMGTPLVKIGELILIWVVLFHSLNGVRLVVFNFYGHAQVLRPAFAQRPLHPNAIGCQSGQGQAGGGCLHRWPPSEKGALSPLSLRERQVASATG